MTLSPGRSEPLGRTLQGEVRHERRTASSGPGSTRSPDKEIRNETENLRLTTGAQAQVYADHFIAVHLEEIGGGKTYSELSAKSNADPENTELATQVQTMFRGETLRGLLLNAHAFDTIGEIAGIAATAAFVGAALLLILSVLGFVHARRITPDVEVLDVGGFEDD